MENLGEISNFDDADNPKTPEACTRIFDAANASTCAQDQVWNFVIENLKIDALSVT